MYRSQIIYIVIPAHNEERRISQTLDELTNLGYQHIIVVDDGSSDHTSQRASIYATVVRHSIQRGYGAALTTGTQYALSNNADVIVHFDADGQHCAQDIQNLVAPIISNQFDIVFGSRYLNQKQKLPITKKYFIHKPALFIQYLSTGMKFTDIHNGLRALSKRAAETLNIQHSGMAYSSEIVSEVKRHHLRYCEIPVSIRYHEYGQGFVNGIKIYIDIISKKIFK